MTARERVRRLVDGELSAEQEATLLAEAEGDRSLARLIEEERTLQRGMRALRAETPAASTDLVERSMNRALESRPEDETRRRGRRALAGGALAMAAVALLVWRVHPTDQREVEHGATPGPQRDERPADGHAAGGTAIAETQAEPRDEAEGDPTPARDAVAVRFELEAPDASSVAVAGDFNDWNPATARLRDDDDDGVFATTLRLPRGSYDYMFVVDGQRWRTDPAAGNYRDDGFGHRNAVLRIN